MYRLFKSLVFDTQRLLVAPFEDEDLASVYDMHCSADVNQYIPYNTWQSWRDAEEWLELIRKRRADEEAQIFTLKLKENGELIGTSLVFGADKTALDLSFGYVLRQKYWGHGYASEAMQGMVGALLSIPEIPQLNATVQEGNIASMKVLIKLGFDDMGKDADPDGTLIRRFEKRSLAST
jgi:RimJ/RimL family protein N-acetyltransferase